MHRDARSRRLPAPRYWEPRRGRCCLMMGGASPGMVLDALIVKPPEGGRLIEHDASIHLLRPYFIRDGAKGRNLQVFRRDIGARIRYHHLLLKQRLGPSCVPVCLARGQLCPRSGNSARARVAIAPWFGELPPLFLSRNASSVRKFDDCFQRCLFQIADGLLNDLLTIRPTDIAGLSMCRCSAFRK